MALTFGRRRQIDRYDGQTIFIGNQVAYELGNYLGGGASGSVYQALDVSSQNPQEKSVAIKILKPLGYKILPYGQLAKCIVASKGQPLNQKQIHGKAPLTADNLWWLVHSSSEHVYAAYEDASRGQLRELTLPRCIEIWGWAPLGSDRLSPEIVEKKNLSGQSFVVSNTSVIQLPTVAPKYLRWLQSRATICREMNNMIHIGEHPNIVDLLEVLELIQDSKAVLFLVLEFVNGGELFDRMKRSSGPGTPSDEFARRYFSQLLSGIDYCHCKGVVHRDLKPENLLLSDPSESAILKIADFGLSAVVFATEGVDAATSHASPFALPSSNYLTSPGGNDRDLDYLTVTGNDCEGQHVHFNQPNSPIQILHSPLATHKQHSQSLPMNTPSPVPLRRLRSVVGSPHYIAPEIVNHEDPCGYDGRKVDMWSAGVILYSLLTGSLPFGGDLSSCPRYKVYKQWMLSEYGPAVREGRLKDLVLPVWFFPPCISTLAGSLILQLIHVDPLQRCTAAEALRHPWSTGEGAKPAVTDLNTSISRSQLKGVKLLQPDDSALPCIPVTFTDKDREKAKASKGSHREVKDKDKRASAPPSPVVTVPATISPQSAVRSGKPFRSHSSVTLCVPATYAQNTAHATSGSSSPTLTSLTSVATALASFSADTGRHTDLEIEEIVITEETICSSQHSPHLVEESRGLLSEAASAITRPDTTAHITVVESTSQVVVRGRGLQAPCQQPASTCIHGEVAVSTFVVATLPAAASSPNPPRFSGRPSSASIESTRNRDRGDTQPSLNQSQPLANTVAYPRGEQCRQGQDREEEERKERERYQSILEQQRQKEAAALAMDSQADQTHTAYATATGQSHPNREPAPLRDPSRTMNPNSMFVHNENDHVASETLEAPPPNQRIHISAASENTTVGNSYIVGENNNYNCDQHK